MIAVRSERRHQSLDDQVAEHGLALLSLPAHDPPAWICDRCGGSGWYSPCVRRHAFGLDEASAMDAYFSCCGACESEPCSACFGGIDVLVPDEIDDPLEHIVSIAALTHCEAPSVHRATSVVGEDAIPF